MLCHGVSHLISFPSIQVIFPCMLVWGFCKKGGTNTHYSSLMHFWMAAQALQHSAARRSSSQLLHHRAASPCHHLPPAQLASSHLPPPRSGTAAPVSSMARRSQTCATVLRRRPQRRPPPPRPDPAPVHRRLSLPAPAAAISTATSLSPPMAPSPARLLSPRSDAAMATAASPQRAGPPQPAGSASSRPVRPAPPRIQPGSSLHHRATLEPCASDLLGPAASPPPPPSSPQIRPSRVGLVFLGPDLRRPWFFLRPAAARHLHRRHLPKSLRFLPPCLLCVCEYASKKLFVSLQVRPLLTLAVPSQCSSSRSLAGDDHHPKLSAVVLVLSPGAPPSPTVLKSCLRISYWLSSNRYIEYESDPLQQESYLRQRGRG